MSIYVYRNQQQAGPFEETIVLGWLKNGLLSGEDFACRAGAGDWQPLKNLFSSGAQSSASIGAHNAGAGQTFFNQPVVNWARQNLQPPVEIKLRHDSLVSKIFVGFAYAILAVCLLWLPCAVLLGTIYSFATKGWSRDVAGGLIGGMVLSIVLGGMFFGLTYLLRATRRKIAAVLNSEGVKTRGGKQYLWENLYFLNYKKESTRVHGNLAATVAKTAVMAGVEKITVELVFANGRAVVPPLIFNQPEILGLLAGIPAQRRDEGKIRQ